MQIEARRPFGPLPAYCTQNTGQQPPALAPGYQRVENFEGPPLLAICVSVPVSRFPPIESLFCAAPAQPDRTSPSPSPPRPHDRFEPRSPVALPRALTETRRPHDDCFLTFFPLCPTRFMDV